MSGPELSGADGPDEVADPGREPVDPGEPAPPALEPDPPTAGLAIADAASRPTDLRLARVHLRMGALDLARAELEAFAGTGSLDPEALLDLAEVRWRTGDLGGAGVAAEAYLGTDREEPVALVIAAEAAAAVARYGEARRMAARTLELVGDDLDPLFAGMPRSAVWPADRHIVAASADGLFGDEARPRTAGSETFVGAATAGAMAGPATADEPAEGGPGTTDAELAAQPGLWGPAAPDEVGEGDAGPDEAEPDEAPPAAAPPASTPAPGPAAASDDLAAARAAMELGDQDEAARRLADLLQQRPDLAATILGALPARDGRTDVDEQAVGGEDPDRPDPGRPSV